MLQRGVDVSGRRATPMTDAEWLACTDPMQMLNFVRGKTSNRKRRLLAVACVRRVWHLLDERGRKEVEEAERYADGLADRRELENAIRSDPDRGLMLPERDAAEAVGWARQTRRHCLILRDIFGNPFRPVTIDPAWLRWKFDTVSAIARHVYEDRAFHDLPILADALEDAGCTNADILTHCRQPGEHARGCWVVDLLLGKE
jgi:hypothetical protein